MNLQSALDAVTQLLPESGSGVSLDFTDSMQFLLFFAGFALLVTVLGRMILGKRSSLNHCISSAMGILFLYAASMILYTFQPWSVLETLTPLPFMVFAGDYMMLISFQNGAFSVICHELLSLIILAFLFNLLDTVMPKGKSILTWYLLRLLTMALAMVLHVAVDWAFDTYLPDVLVTYAPVILLGILFSLLLMGILNFLLGLLLAVFDPILGGIYTFFFSNIIGKQLTKAVATSFILCAVFFLMGHWGYSLICVTEGALLTYIPIGLAMLILWFIIGHML